MPQRLFRSEYLILVLCVAYYGVMAIAAPGFATVRNGGNIVSAMLPLLVAATGQTIVLIVAGIDLSMTAVIAFASVTVAMAMTGNAGESLGIAAAPAGVIIMLAAGAGIGFVNGALITAFRMPAFIVTLTMMMFISGIAIWMTKSTSIYNLPESFLYAGKHTWCGALLAACLAIVAHLMLTRTLLGRWLYAAGHNPKAATISGVPVNKVTILAFVACGLCAGVAAILITGRLETGSPVHWQKNLLDIIGATVIGGTSLFGGKGKVLWTVFGVLFLTLIDNSLNLLNLSHFTIMMAKGSVILLAAMLDAARNRSSAA
ncbi:MAG: ribose/xylose/arabinose/galactoside ABC-type transport system permease subunit [Verrucomicrobiales bacterium]|jgi:ribose/xylose/arabinose/galactoside ABC-type transport system permease subunit